MRLEEEFAGILSEEIAREIDKEILETLMIDMLTSEGWIPTKINPTFKIDWYIETAAWIHLNATGDYKLLQGQWLFKDPRDATIFILRWSQ